MEKIDSIRKNTGRDDKSCVERSYIPLLGVTPYISSSLRNLKKDQTKTWHDSMQIDYNKTRG